MVRRRDVLPDHLTVVCVSRTGVHRHAGAAVIDPDNIVLKGNIYFTPSEHTCYQGSGEMRCAAIAALRTLEKLLWVLDDHRTATIQFTEEATTRWVREWLAGNNPIPNWYTAKDMRVLGEMITSLGPSRLSVETVRKQRSPLVGVALQFASLVEDALATRDAGQARTTFNAAVAQLRKDM